MGPKKKQTTPSKSKDDSIDLQETFSPVKGKGSLESPGLRQGNLTGTVRKLKDGAADLYNLVQKWNILNVDGANLITQIANIKLEQIETENLDVLPDSLLPLCDQMTQLLEKMEKLVCRLSGMLETVKGMVQLERYNQPNSAEIVLFQTWDVSKFEEVHQEIYNMLKKEIELKKCIAANICHKNSRDIIMFYSAAWLHQPYKEDHFDQLIESQLLETRHKT